jgi:hypothetical protein
MDESKMKYFKKGQVVAVNAIITLIIGFGVSTLILIFVGVLGGQTYQLTQAQIGNITNTSIRTNIQNSIMYAFQSQQTIGQYMPLIALAVIIFIILGLILSLTVLGGGRGMMGGGQAL